ncbi:putative acetyltransferase (GNAT) domain containing protein [Lyophyllum shimeji]|uniref:Acetyltransferase (GNAT) domain containing protein n=1 Tax=Lyophyllum shimeji TaxID=47721 RepID=A0A9P3URQ4_LYOSH|nr:putative acetyltransferase (GNAT) domain containing protein [Lyophyllum shimeji]
MSNVALCRSLNESGTINFCLPLPPVIETRRVTLTPFIPSHHGDAFFNGFAAAGPDLSCYLPISFPTYEALLEFVHRVGSDPSSVLFAIIDKTKGTKGSARMDECLAGMIGFLHASERNRALEIGPIIVLPAFQRTFVATNAIGALLKYCLDVPADGGLGLRRVCWTAHPENAASVKAAERMGMKREGLMRWTWTLPPEKVGRPCGKERGEGLGRDSILLAICWDDWEEGAKEQVEKLIERS